MCSATTGTTATTRTPGTQQCSSQQTCDFVPEEDIIGQAWVTYWPFDELGFVNNKIAETERALTPPCYFSATNAA